MRILLSLLLVSAACAHRPATAANVDYATLVQAPDRTEADRALDPGRKPVPFLEFIEPAPGMKVGELFAGTGYTTELLARAVGPDGTVYAQNTPQAIQRFLDKPWSDRLTRPANKHVVRADRPLEDPFPPEAVSHLDLVVTNANYHDAVWTGADRTKMNTAVFNALHPGGDYVICDSSAKEGSGPKDAQTLHRIDEKLVEQEVLSVGFRLEGRGDFLRNPTDTRDWNASPVEAGARRGQSDRFCLRFARP